MKKENGSGQDSKTPGKKRIRSPNYPAIDLMEAVAKIEAIYANDKRQASHVDAIADHWGYKRGSSRVFLHLAALKSFGLMEKAGEDGRHLKLTSLGVDIALEDKDTISYKELLKKAALTPQIHSTTKGGISNMNPTSFFTQSLPLSTGTAAFLIPINMDEQDKKKLLSVLEFIKNIYLSDEEK